MQDGEVGGEIVGLTIDEMRSEFDTWPEEIVAAIGPGIGKCCYQVGEEVGRRFGLDSAGKIDLAAINREQLMNSGVPTSQIDTFNACTKGDAERWWSYRRDGDSCQDDFVDQNQNAGVKSGVPISEFLLRRR